MHGCDFRFCFPVWFCSIVGIVLFFCLMSLCAFCYSFFLNYDSNCEEYYQGVVDKVNLIDEEHLTQMIYYNHSWRNIG